MPTRRFAKPFCLVLASSLFGLFVSCNLNLKIPDYFIDVQTTNVAYKDPSAVPIRYKFTAEQDQHYCRCVLSNGNGQELERYTERRSAGVWYDLLLNLVPYGGNDGRYSYRLTVQSETSDGKMEDLEFLDKAVVFYIDNKPPGLPIISPTPAISSQPVYVKLDHADNHDPNASPVTLYYTLDGSPPNSLSTKYTGKFLIDLSDTPVEVKAIAIDSVNESGPVEPFEYKFLNITCVAKPGFDDPDPVIKILDVSATKDLLGYGFPDIDEQTVYDHDNTEVSTTIDLISDTRLRIFISMDSIKEDPNGTGFEPGPGTIKIIDTDSGVYDTYSITIQ
jgi:hypothetical protein